VVKARDGVSVQVSVIMIEYINHLRAQGYSIEDAAVERAILRLRPVMMTMLVAMLGLLPAALSRGIGSDSQRPFAIVIVADCLLHYSSASICCRRCTSWWHETLTCSR
jgi:heavy metal efflux system protein